MLLIVTSYTLHKGPTTIVSYSPSALNFYNTTSTQPTYVKRLKTKILICMEIHPARAGVVVVNSGVVGLAPDLQSRLRRWPALNRAVFSSRNSSHQK
jgi:hypothetical protein